MKRTGHLPFGLCPLYLSALLISAVVRTWIVLSKPLTRLLARQQPKEGRELSPGQQCRVGEVCLAVGRIAVLKQSAY